MFDVGFWEIGLLAVIALVVVGPERLPGLVRRAGLWLGKARRVVRDLKAEVEREFQLQEIQRSIGRQSGADELKGLADDLRSAAGEARPGDTTKPKSEPPREEG